jgi:hypothetical protein
MGEGIYPEDEVEDYFQKQMSDLDRIFEHMLLWLASVKTIQVREDSALDYEPRGFQSWCSVWSTQMRRRGIGFERTTDTGLAGRERRTTYNVEDDDADPFYHADSTDDDEHEDEGGNSESDDGEHISV